MQWKRGYLKQDFIILYVQVFVCMYEKCTMHTMHTEAKEGIGSPGNGVSDYELLRTNLGPLQEQ